MERTHSCLRDRHLFAPGKKRILALDGGGVRGALSIAFLERLEKILTEIEGRPVRLCVRRGYGIVSDGQFIQHHSTI